MCGDKSSGFHFGVYTCEACKGFFRRCNKKFKANLGPCSKRCIVTKESRNNCARCRFQRCISVGMAVEKIRFGKTPKHVANLIMNATKHMNQNIVLNPTNGTIDVNNTTSGLVDVNTNYINQSLENLLTTISSYIDATTQEYLTILQHKHNNNNNYGHPSTCQYSSVNSNQNNIINFSINTPQYSDFQQSSVYLTPSTSSSSLPQSNSTSPYLNNSQHQHRQSSASSDTSCIQELLRKLKHKIVKILNDYLSNVKVNNNQDFPKLNGDLDKLKNMNSLRESFQSYQTTNDNKLCGSVDSLIVAFLVLVISDQTSQIKTENVSEITTSSATTSSFNYHQLSSYFDLEFNLITNSINKALLKNLKSTFDRVYNNCSEDSNRTIKMLHFVLILLVENYFSRTVSKKVSNNNESYFTESGNDFYDDNNENNEVDENEDEAEDDDDNEDINYDITNSFRFQKVIAGLIGLKCHNKWTKHRILLSLENFL